MVPFVRTLAVLVIAAAAMSGVVACASILAIEDTAFASLEAGVEAGVGNPPATKTAPPEAGSAGVDGGDGGRNTCMLASGKVCAQCLDTTCSSCPAGTRNLALRGRPETYSALDSAHDATKLNDGRLVTSWLSEPFQTLPGEIRIVLEDVANVTSVTVYSVRGEHTHDVKEMSLELIQGLNDISPGALPEKNGAGDISWYPTEPLPNILQVIFRIRSTTTAEPPGISEIEVCGF